MNDGFIGEITLITGLVAREVELPMEKEIAQFSWVRESRDSLVLSLHSEPACVPEALGFPGVLVPT